MTIKQIYQLTITAAVVVLVLYYYYPEQKLPVNTKIDSLVVYKSKRQLVAYSNGQIVKIYKISLGGNPKGKKEYEGDKKTPEGTYSINGKNDKSGYFKNLAISYPNKEDIAFAKSQSRSAGGAVKIHGLRNGLGAIGKFHRWFDWTLGCVAVTNDEMEELYNTVEVGTPIEIKL